MPPRACKQSHEAEVGFQRMHACCMIMRKSSSGRAGAFSRRHPNCNQELCSCRHAAQGWKKTAATSIQVRQKQIMKQHSHARVDGCLCNLSISKQGVASGLMRRHQRERCNTMQVAPLGSEGLYSAACQELCMAPMLV